jgi:hypothetical protein
MEVWGGAVGQRLLVRAERLLVHFILGLTCGGAHRYCKYMQCTTNVPASKDLGCKTARVRQTKDPAGVWLTMRQKGRRRVATVYLDVPLLLLYH